MNAPQKPSIAAVTAALHDAAHRARAGHAATVEAHKRAEAAAQRTAADRELRLDAKSRRQAAARAEAGLKAIAHLKDAHVTYHKLSAEALRRALPTTPAHAGEALKQRSEIDAFFQLEEGRQGELLRTDQRMREVLLGSGNRFDLERASKIPTIDFEAITEQARREYSPMLTDSIDTARREAMDTIKATARVVAAGLTNAPVTVGGLAPQRQAGDICQRYVQLPADWDPSTDPIYQADISALEARAAAGNLEQSA